MLALLDAGGASCERSRLWRCWPVCCVWEPSRAAGAQCVTDDDANAARKALKKATTCNDKRLRSGPTASCTLLPPPACSGKPRHRRRRARLRAEQSRRHRGRQPAPARPAQMPEAHRQGRLALRRHQAPLPRSAAGRRPRPKRRPSSSSTSSPTSAPSRSPRRQRRRAARRRTAVRGRGRAPGSTVDTDGAARLPAPALRMWVDRFGPESAAAAAEHPLHPDRRSALGHHRRHALARAAPTHAGHARRARPTPGSNSPTPS